MKDYEKSENVFYNSIKKTFESNYFLTIVDVNKKKYVIDKQSFDKEEYKTLLSYLNSGFKDCNV